jgi:hypothetical protein
MVDPFPFLNCSGSLPQPAQGTVFADDLFSISARKEEGLQRKADIVTAFAEYSIFVLLQQNFVPLLNSGA